MRAAIAVQREARRIAADILTNLNWDDLDGRLPTGVTREFETDVYRAVRTLGAQIGDPR